MEQERGRGVVTVDKPKYYKKWLLLLESNNIEKLDYNPRKKQ